MGLCFPVYTRARNDRITQEGLRYFPTALWVWPSKQGLDCGSVVKSLLNKREDPSSSPAVLPYTLHPSAGEPETRKAWDLLTSLAHVAKNNIYSTRGMTPGIYSSFYTHTHTKQTNKQTKNSTTFLKSTKPKLSRPDFHRTF